MIAKSLLLVIVVCSFCGIEARYFQCNLGEIKTDCLARLKESLSPKIDIQVRYALCTLAVAESLEKKLIDPIAKTQLGKHKLAVKTTILKWHADRLRVATKEMEEVMKIVNKHDAKQLVGFYSPHRFYDKTQRYLYISNWSTSKISKLAKKFSKEVPQLPVMIKCESPSKASQRLEEYKLKIKKPIVSNKLLVEARNTSRVLKDQKLATRHHVHIGASLTSTQIPAGSSTTKKPE
ncbi:hypothetical protein Ciccas_006311 [Cichlidogyrus casuarinus]|uniref:Uncharacterized protein n=1 Tax=Cichlidogyrus casuarinus TaxID=1844966 RepID=A0ABD2Q654_9PLAT